MLQDAYTLRMTYYDSSYIIAAYELDAELVTDDRKLARRVRENRDKILRLLGREIQVRSTRELSETR